MDAAAPQQHRSTPTLDGCELDVLDSQLPPGQHRLGFQPGVGIAIVVAACGTAGAAYAVASIATLWWTR